LEHLCNDTGAFADQSASANAVEPQPELIEQYESNERVSSDQTGYWLDETGIPIIRATRTWVQYGTLGFAVFCILIGAVEGLFGR
jgi:hypothetical protein